MLLAVGVGSNPTSDNYFTIFQCWYLFCIYIQTFYIQVKTDRIFSNIAKYKCITKNVGHKCCIAYFMTLSLIFYRVNSRQCCCSRSVTACSQTVNVYVLSKYFIITIVVVCKIKISALSNNCQKWDSNPRQQKWTAT